MSHIILKHSVALCVQRMGVGVGVHPGIAHLCQDSKARIKVITQKTFAHS